MNRKHSKSDTTYKSYPSFLSNLSLFNINHIHDKSSFAHVCQARFHCKCSLSMVFRSNAIKTYFKIFLKILYIYGKLNNDKKYITTDWMNLPSSSMIPVDAIRHSITFHLKCYKYSRIM